MQFPDACQTRHWQRQQRCRVLPDRRRNRLRSLPYQFVNGRRLGERRQGVYEHYVDRHEASLLLAILLTLVCCIADTYFTLLLLGAGGVELNPVMRALIERDIALFYTSKYVLTALGLIFLVMHKNFRIMRTVSGEQLIYLVLAGYLLLIGYEVKLLIMAKILVV